MQYSAIAPAMHVHILILRSVEAFIDGEPESFSLVARVSRPWPTKQTAAARSRVHPAYGLGVNASRLPEPWLRPVVPWATGRMPVPRGSGHGQVATPGLDSAVYTSGNETIRGKASPRCQR